jgi:ribose transport system substrate-binding protein
MHKKPAAILFVLVLLIGVAAGNALCGGKKEAGNTVYVFGPAPDHGWTGSVARFAEEKIAALNKVPGARYNYVFKSADSPDAQIAQIESMLTERKYPAGVVIQASNDSVGPAIEKIAAANIPLILFDRLVDDQSKLVRDKMLVALCGNNFYVGAGVAYYMAERGLTPGEAIWELPGDLSPATRERSVAFREYLLGTRSFHDEKGVEHWVPADKKWTQAQIDSAIVSSQVANWSRDNAKQFFESYIAGKTKDTLAKWFFLHDDEFVLGILELLQTPAKTQERELFESTVKVVSGCGGLQALYDVMNRTKATAGNAIYQPDGIDIVCATYRPGFIVNAIQLMDEYLGGKDITVYYTEPDLKRYQEPSYLVDTAALKAHAGDPVYIGFD